MANMRKYLMNVLSTTLRTEDLNPTRLQELIEGFQFAARKERAISVDISFTLHGNTVIFFSFDQTFFQNAIFSNFSPQKFFFLCFCVFVFYYFVIL